MENQNRFKDLPGVIFERIKDKRNKGLEGWINEEELNPGLYRAIEELSLCLGNPETSIYKMFFVDWKPRPIQQENSQEFMNVIGFSTRSNDNQKIIAFDVHGIGPLFGDYIHNTIFPTISRFLGWYLYHPNIFSLLGLDYENIITCHEFSFSFTPPAEIKESFEELVWQVIDSISFLNRYGNRWAKALADIRSDKVKEIDNVKYITEDPKPLEWMDIAIEFKGIETVLVEIRNRKKYSLTYHQMGLKDERKNEDGTHWKKPWTTLMILALNGTEYESSLPRAKQGKTHRYNAKDISKLRDVLKKHFGIDQNPLPYDKEEKDWIPSLKIKPGSAKEKIFDAILKK